MGGRPSFIQRRVTFGDVAEGRLDRAAAVVGVARKRPLALHHDGEVEFPVFLESGALVFREDAVDQVAAALRIQSMVRDGRELAVDAHHGRRADAEMQVGRAARDGLLQEFDDVEVHDEFGQARSWRSRLACCWS